MARTQLDSVEDRAQDRVENRVGNDVTSEPSARTDISALSAADSGQRQARRAKAAAPLNHAESLPDIPPSIRFTVLAFSLALPLVVTAAYWQRVGEAIADKILFASFVVFAVGLAELFLLMMALAILGRIDLAKVFQDKDNLSDEGASNEPLYVRAVAGRGSVSLSRLQAFLWTLIIMTTYFHKAVVNESSELPSIPADLLLVMGISGALYLTSKQINARGKAPRTKGANDV